MLWLASVAVARAQGSDEDGCVRHIRGRIELGLSGRADVYSSLFVLSGVASADYAFSHGYGVGFDWGFFLASEEPSSDLSARYAVGPGDPWLKVWHEAALGRSTQLRVAAGMTVPAAWLRTNR